MHLILRLMHPHMHSSDDLIALMISFPSTSDDVIKIASLPLPIVMVQGQPWWRHHPYESATTCFKVNHGVKFGYGICRHYPTDTVSNNCILVKRTLPWRRLEYRPKHVGYNIVNKIYHGILKSILTVIYIFLDILFRVSLVLLEWSSNLFHLYSSWFFSFYPDKCRDIEPNVMTAPSFHIV
jgi:hypothetical protein